MDISKIPNAVWKDLLAGKTNREFEFLGFKILLARLRLVISRDPSPAALQKSIEELKSMFTRFGHLPAAQNDLAKILADRRIS
jgi:hypothetical protein